MDSTTAQPSFASFLNERRRQPHAQVLTLVAGLADPAGRREAARRLAAHARGDDLLIFLRDPQVKLLLPAPGFPQTLPEPRRWRQLLDGCMRDGRCAGEVRVPGQEQTLVTATAYAAEDDTVLVLTGAEPEVNVVAEVCMLLPLVAAALRRESNSRAAEAHASVAREAAVQTKLLAASLDSARVALKKALGDAEAANAAKDRFLAALSHELRTPLSPVILAVAAMETHSDLPFELREDVAMIQRNLQLETRLMDDLLDLSRVANGKLRLLMQPTHVHEVLRYALDTVRSDVLGKRLNVTMDLTASVDQVTGDPARLQQVFWNLLRNAVKFTPEGGNILVATTNDQQGSVCFKVRDTGLGIASEVLARIFDPFEQGDPKVVQQFGGLGLGLAIAKAVVDMHGGTIRAESDGPGTGATFTVTLATVKTKRDDVSRLVPPGMREGEARSRVLLVEDHVDTAHVLAKLLRSSGYRVKTATSVAMALEVAAAEPFDVVVSDVGLPDATGYELMKQISERYGLKGIALTGYGMEDDMRQSRESGFVDHLTKPVDLRKLEEAIQRIAAS